MAIATGLPLRRTVTRVRRAMLVSDRPALVLLGTIALLLTMASARWPALFPFGVLLLPMFVGSLWLGPRTLPWFVVFCCSCVAVLVLIYGAQSVQVVVRVLITFLLALLIMVTSFRRSRLGVSGPIGESIFIDLRDRISKQGILPDLPPDWHVESEVRSAGGTAFAGDFVVARRTRGGYLELVLVDVSGKGVEAGSRALFLSGALNGIVSALPGERFLPAANDYLLDQSWDEGFATAIHLHLDLHSGEFELRKAGHPPAVWLHAGSGRWEVLASEGPVLGLIPGTDFECVRGRLMPGDAMLLFTDGLVETSDRDVDLGIDRLAGFAERLLQRGFQGSAHLLLDAMEQTNDDRALVVVHRRS